MEARPSAPRRPSRRLIAFRLSESGHNWIRDLATEAGVDKTTVFRAALAVARNHEAETKSIIRKYEEEA